MLPVEIVALVGGKTRLDRLMLKRQSDNRLKAQLFTGLKQLVGVSRVRDQNGFQIGCALVELFELGASNAFLARAFGLANEMSFDRPIELGWVIGDNSADKGADTLNGEHRRHEIRTL